jgi:23S rRNA (uracil1939-C5)-methyltransferase
VTFAVSAEHLGYHRVGDADRVFDVRECLVAEPAVKRLHKAVRAARSSLPKHATRVVLRRDRDDSLHVVVRTDGDEAWRHGATLHARLKASGVEAVVWWHPEGGAPRAVAGSDNPWPATVFEQIHPVMGRMVRQAALDALGEVAGLHAWDLYAGIGETTVALFARGASVDSVELDARAVTVAERLGPAGPRRLTGRAEERMGQLKSPAVIVTNPPRTGMDAAVTSAIAESGAGRVAYISCDAATLARDLTRLAGRYRLEHVAAFDQFPQTAHLECLALLERL